MKLMSVETVCGARGDILIKEGRIYDIIEYDDETYKVICDDGKPGCFWKCRFVEFNCDKCTTRKCNYCKIKKGNNCKENKFLNKENR